MSFYRPAERFAQSTSLAATRSVLKKTSPKLAAATGQPYPSANSRLSLVRRLIPTRVRSLIPLRVKRGLFELFG